jgi:DNA replication protein DnaC
MKAPNTFEGYNFDRIHGRDSEAVRSLSTLSEVYADKNLALIGPRGGKTSARSV